MRIGRSEIIEELTEHIRQSGGEPGEWRVGTAGGQWLGEIERFKLQNSRETPASMAGLAFREAHTTYAADDAVDYLVSAFGLKLAPEAERGSALQNPAPGRIVFVYRPTKEAISHQLSAVSKSGASLGSY